VFDSRAVGAAPAVVDVLCHGYSKGPEAGGMLGEIGAIQREIWVESA
jgi:hypothetical protein